MGELRVVVMASGNGSNFETLVNAEKSRALGSARIIGLITDQGKAKVLRRARRLGVAAYVVERSGFSRPQHEHAVLQRLMDLKPDLIVLAGWMRVLSGAFLDQLDCRVINLHPALPGRYPGLNAMRRAFDSADTVSGVMVHEVSTDLDAGPVLMAECVPILHKEGFEGFVARMHDTEHALLIRCVRALADTV